MTHKDGYLLEQPNLQQLVEEISITFFKRPFKHQASYNKRLKTTGGRYHLASHHLDFNPLIVERYGKEELVKVIKHELCHYHLHLAGKGYQHRDRDFKGLFAATGGSRFAPPLVDPQRKSPKYIYECRQCGKVYPRQKQINLRRYGCRCGGKLKMTATH